MSLSVPCGFCGGPKAVGCWHDCPDAMMAQYASERLDPRPRRKRNPARVAWRACRAWQKACRLTLEHEPRRHHEAIVALDRLPPVPNSRIGRAVLILKGCAVGGYIEQAAVISCALRTLRTWQINKPGQIGWGLSSGANYKVANKRAEFARMRDKLIS